MVSDYIPIDLREIKDKNRVSVSSDLLKILGKPDRIVFSRYVVNGDTKIVVNNADDVVMGESIGMTVNVDQKQRITITQKVQNEMGFKNDGKKKFIGFFHTQNKKGGRVVELCKVVPKKEIDSE